MWDFVEEKVKEYIQNEIEYIEKENSICGFDKGRFSDLLMLETLKQEDINYIVDKIIEGEDFYDNIDEMIHYYLYEEKRINK